MALIIITIFVLLIYAWIIYPLLLAVFVRDKVDTRNNKIECSDNFPFIAILFSAFNEETHIGSRIENLLSLNYPVNRMAIYIGIDGATDKTSDIAYEIAGKTDNVYVYAYSERRGKVAVLKDLVKVSKSATKEFCPGILVFTDANTVFNNEVLNKFVIRFKDLKMGGVCGRLVFNELNSNKSEKESNSSSESVYWRLENFLKKKESFIDSCLGANGAVYAIRKDLFWQDIPDNTIIDDFVLGMKVREQGYKMVYAPDIVAEENLPKSIADEWRRRVRIGAGDFQALGFCWKCLLPLYRKFAWILWSHKVLRWFTPHMFLLLLFCVEWISWRLPYTGWIVLIHVISGACLLFILSVPAYINTLRKGSAIIRFICLCNYFLTMNTALFFGFLRYCRGNLSGKWDRTPRSSKITL